LKHRDFGCRALSLKFPDISFKSRIFTGFRRWVIPAFSNTLFIFLICMSFHPLTPDRDVNIKISQIEKRNKEKNFFLWQTFAG
jgi:hypothetical protein